MATPKQAHALVTYYSQQYEKKYGFKPVANRYKARWGFDTVLMDMSPDATIALIDYYFETASPNGHDLEWFFYNYDKLVIAKQKRDEDVKSLTALREASKTRAEEWRKKNSGNN